MGQKTVYPDRGESLTSDMERFDETLSLGQLEKCESFPEPFPMLLLKENHEKFDKVALMSKVSDIDALGQNQPFVDCLALKPTVCLVMERVEFLRIMTNAMRQKLMEASKVYFIGVEQMQNQWILTQGWQNYKNNLISSMKEENEQKKLLSRVQVVSQFNQHFD